MVRLFQLHSAAHLSRNTMHPVEADIREWSQNFLEVPSEALGGLAPCPYARTAFLNDKVKFSINTGVGGLSLEVSAFKNNDYDIVIWADETLPEVGYLDGFCDAINRTMAASDMHLMMFHPDYPADDAGLDFLVDHSVSEDSDLTYCMVFVQNLSKVDDASVYLEKTGYYSYFPEDVHNELVLERRKLRYGNG